jgi:hypothetical protein
MQGPRPQLPPAQAAVPFVGAAQAFPHAPQWATFVRTSASHPFAAFPSQFPNPVAQVAIPQTPAAQTPVEFAGAQAAPHAPQWAALVRRSVSQPVAAPPSQSP